MSLFGNLKTEGLEESQDRIGGFGAVETNYYEGVIKVAYATTAASGAKAVNLIVALAGKEYRETIYVTNKKGENWFLNKDDKTKKVPLPGFTTVDDICLCATEKPLAEQDIEEKVVNVFDFEAKKELPKNVPVLVELTGKTVGFGIVKTLENKGVKQPDGSYIDGPEERDVNHIDKVFHVPTGLTMVEVRAGTKPEDAAFRDKWTEANRNKTRDKRSIKNGQGGAQAGAPRQTAAPQQGGTPARKSLFGK